MAPDLLFNARGPASPVLVGDNPCQLVPAVLKVFGPELKDVLFPNLMRAQRGGQDFNWRQSNLAPFTTQPDPGKWKESPQYVSEMDFRGSTDFAGKKFWEDLRGAAVQDDELRGFLEKAEVCVCVQLLCLAASSTHTNMVC